LKPLSQSTHRKALRALELVDDLKPGAAIDLLKELCFLGTGPDAMENISPA
jgi:hypothetical protein